MSGLDANSKRKYFRIADLLVAAVVIVAAAVGLIALFSSDDEALSAVISVRGEVYTEIDLASVDEPYNLTVQGDREAVLRISPDGVQFVTSDCPDKLCVNTGLLTSSGQSAVCLPARVSVKLVSSDNSEHLDAVVG